MRPRTIAIVVALLLVPLLYLLFRPRTPTPSSTTPAPKSALTAEQRRARAAEAAAAIREEVLSRRLLAGLPRGAQGGPRGVVMDWNLGPGLATLVAIDDGSVSLYLNPGGGTIGAGTHDSVARAAVAFRAEATRATDAFKPVTTFRPPGPDSMEFYILTDSSTLATGPIGVDALQRAGHPLAPLGAAAQALLTEVRKLR